VVVATKVYMAMGPGENSGGLSRKHILSGIDASLQRLGMDYVDLYQIHRWDYRTPIEETMEMIPQCIDQGVAVIPWSPLARIARRSTPNPETSASRREVRRQTAVRASAASRTLKLRSSGVARR
jgi:aryl-alcohol dehydrogenase-like predicted oxidoreductase